MIELHVTRVIQLAECDHDFAKGVLLLQSRYRFVNCTKKTKQFILIILVSFVYYFLFPLFVRSFLVLYVNFIMCSNLKIALTLTPMVIRFASPRRDL